jgi:hypothetical protein
MTPLPASFRSGGFDFRLVKRTGDIALFEKRKPTHTRSFFEVVIVQKRKEATFPSGRVTPAHEAMPASEQWGSAGWSYSDLEGAEKRFKSLVESRRAQEYGANARNYPKTAAWTCREAGDKPAASPDFCRLEPRR